MNPGKLNRFITIQTLVITQVDGHDTESWSLAETIRAKVTWVDGTRIFKDDELKDRIVAKIECWDNNYSDNLKIGIDDFILYPIKPIMKNPGTSNLIEIIIYAATKTSPILVQ